MTQEFSKRTYELHACAKQVKRAAGRSSVAAAAYRAGEKLLDARTGLTHDYTRKSGVEAKALYMPEDAPNWARQRESLWNAVEQKENRSNSTMAHEFEVGFPAEFNLAQRLEAGETICHELVHRYGCAVDIAYHRPHWRSDERNYHAHILFTTRGFDPASKDGWARNKYRDLSADQVQEGEGATTRGVQEIRALRAFTAQTLNRIAERDGLPVVTEHLSFKERGIDRTPSQHLGPKASKIEAEGKASERGTLNRAISDLNHSRFQIDWARRDIEREYRRMQKEILRLERSEVTRLLAQKHKYFEVQQENLKRAQESYNAAKARIEQLNWTQKLLGQKPVYDADLKEKEQSLKLAQQRLDELARNWAVRSLAQGRLDDPDMNAAAGALRAQKFAAYQQQKEAYQHEQEQLRALQQEQGRLSSQERILAAISGRSDQLERQVSILERNIKAFESSRAYQAEQRYLAKKDLYDRGELRKDRADWHERHLEEDDLAADFSWLSIEDEGWWARDQYNREKDHEPSDLETRKEEARQQILDQLSKGHDQSRGDRSQED